MGHDSPGRRGRLAKDFKSIWRACLLHYRPAWTPSTPTPDFAARLKATGLLSDPWLDGKPRFRQRPLVLGTSELAALYQAAEGVLAVLHELAVICAAEPELVQHWFGLTRAQQIMWAASAPAWHGIARADVFMTENGPVVCEVNCDTPSGEAEAVELGSFATAEQSGCFDPCLNLGDRLCELVESMARPRTEYACRRVRLSHGVFRGPIDDGTVPAGGLKNVAGAWFSAPRSIFALPPTAVWRCSALVVMCCYATTRRTGGASACPCGATSPRYSDPEPLLGPLGLVLGAVLRGRVGVVNPFGAVLAQNKLTFAFMWEEMNRFPVWAQEIIRQLRAQNAAHGGAGTRDLARRAHGLGAQV